MNKDKLDKIKDIINKSLKYIKENDDKKVAKKVMYYYNIKLDKLINIIKEKKIDKVWNISIEI
jgi:flagellin-specific chaperone FliS